MDASPAVPVWPFPSARGRQRWACGPLVVAGAALCLAVTSGCETAGPLPDAVVEAPPSPEKQLEHAMRRLKESLKHARAAPGVGVVSERSCAYELLPPSAEDDGYTARVMIETSVALHREAGVKITPLDKQAKGDEPFKQVDKRYFKLAYKNQRWELVEPPLDELTELERVYFQNALSDG